MKFDGTSGHLSQVELLVQPAFYRSSMFKIHMCKRSFILSFLKGGSELAAIERQRLGDILVESGLITEEQLSVTLSQKNDDEKLGDALLKEGYITEQQLIEVLEFQL